MFGSWGVYEVGYILVPQGPDVPNTMGYFRWTPHPVIVTIRDNRDYIRVLLYSSYTTITGWGVLLRDIIRNPRTGNPKSIVRIE